MMKILWESMPEKYFVVSRTRLRNFQRHTHDFAEVFWVVDGRVQHWVNGHSVTLSPGSLVLIRPDDEHGFTRGEGFVISNLAFPLPILHSMRTRYFPSGVDFWTREQPLPLQIDLTPSQLTILQVGMDELIRGVNARWAIDRFLLNLYQVLQPVTPGGQHHALPLWLRRACNEIQKPQHFQGGTVAFAKLAGRCPEHVARELRRLTNRTPTEIVNEARLRYAAGELLVTDKTVLDIALDSGFQSLGHFYQCFQSAYGFTPRAYRMRNPLSYAGSP